ncbi:MAG: rod-binding protein [Bdellovibrionaceae bacterium]|nr:rod-binding protein [Pseudobdellovibrionaceae bacterium]
MDIKSTKAKPIQQPDQLEGMLRKASKMYEQQFLQEMVRAMRKTVEHSEITKPSMAEQIYQDEMYTQYAEKWVDGGGNGLADQIYTELKEKILPSQYSRYTQPQQAVKPKKEDE